MANKGGQVVIYGDYGRDKDGRRIRKKFTGATEVEARILKAEYERERAIGMHRFSERITVREWVEAWQSAYKTSLRGTNQVSYRVYVDRLLDAIGPMKMRDVRHLHLHRALMDMEGMSRSSQTKYRMVIQQIFSKARQNRVIRDDPSEGLELPEGTSGTHRALEPWETDLILAHWQAHRAGLWALLMLLAGLRRSEMIALDWESVDLERRLIHVHQAAELVGNQPVIRDTTKTEAGTRFVPICAPLLSALETVHLRRRHGPVCLSSKGERLTQSAFGRGMDGFNLAMERILNGEPTDQQGRRSDLLTGEDAARRRFSVRAHDLRHTFCTMLYDSGVDVKSAAYFMGHSDIRVTMEIYTHLTEERRAKSGELIVSYLDSFRRDLPAPEE